MPGHDQTLRSRLEKEVGGLCWFWNGWTHDMDFERINVEPGITVINVLLEFR
jgi:hypothetical protein